MVQTTKAKKGQYPRLRQILSTFAILASVISSGYIFTVASLWLILLINSYLMNQGPDNAWNILVPAEQVLTTVYTIGQNSWPSLGFSAIAVILIANRSRKRSQKHVINLLLGAAIMSIVFANSENKTDYGYTLTFAFLGFCYWLVAGLLITRKITQRLFPN